MVSHQPAPAGQRIGVGDVLVPGQRMADQDGIGPGRVQGAIGPVGDRHGGDDHAAVERQALREEGALVVNLGKRDDGC